jgi:capsular exopolysaccharide synthesis family protein
MSVDEAFRRIMRNNAVRKPEPPPPPEPEPQHEPEPEVKALPEEIDRTATTMVRVLPIALDRVRTVPDFSWRPGAEEEFYKPLRARVQALRLRRNSLLVTSCRHGEGKTTTSLNLAFLLARRREKKILLVDFDTCRPSLSKLLGIPAVHGGLTAVLRGEEEPEDAIIYGERENLFVLPTQKRAGSDTDYYEADGLGKFLRRAHESFDFIVLDAPPCSAGADAGVAGAQAGGALLVVRSLLTPREEVTDAAAILTEMGVNVAGAALTFTREFIPAFLRGDKKRYGYAMEEETSPVT